MTKRFFLLSFLAAIALTLGAGTVRSQTTDPTFPIAQLDNCASKEECRKFCDQPEHAEACIDYGVKQGKIDPGLADSLKNSISKGGPGGCRTDSQCRAYCADPLHTEECLGYARQHGLITSEEVRQAETIIEKPGPGGCRGEECRAYCEDPVHTDECLDFGVKNGLMSKEEAEMIRAHRHKVEQIEQGPGGCEGEEQCRAYCEDPAHLDECLAFAEEHGFIKKEEAVRIKKTGLAGGPGGCKGKDECRLYCEAPDHQIICVDFAEQNGFMSHEEAERARKFVNQTGPGGCRGRECEQFCHKPENRESCFEHAVREGLIPPEEVARIKKFMSATEQGGPGGCQGEQCRAYCEDPAHRDECFEFGKKKGLINKEQEQEFRSGMQIQKKMQESGGPGGCKTEDECRMYCADPSHVEECIAFAAAHGGVDPEKARMMLREFTERRFEGHGEFHAPEEFEKFEREARRRFEEFRTLEQEFRGKEFMMPPSARGFPGRPGEFPGRPGEFPGGPQGGTAGFVGPGGCTSPVECIKYCAEHQEECFQQGGSKEEPHDRGRGMPPPEFIPRIRHDIVKEVRHEDLPSGFEMLPEEEKRKFFMEKYGPPPGGIMPEGRPGMYPQGQFPPKDGEFRNHTAPGEHGPEPFRGIGPQPGSMGIFGPVEGAVRPEGWRPPPIEGEPNQIPVRSGEGSGMMPPPMEGQPPGGTYPPTGYQGYQSPSGEGTHIYYPPPSGEQGQFHPPPSGETYQQPPPSGETYQQPPSSGETYQAPPPSDTTSQPPPTSQAPKRPFLSRLWAFLIGR